ncbi:MAG: tetratricopeptide repeat protein [Anaerolineales bacterium]|jgi:tetratricopeptide (TPR) repeat protein
MARFLHLDLLVRLLAPLLLIPLLGISTRPHFVERYLREGNLAEGFGAYQSAARSIAHVAGYYEWRADLWEKAGLLAIKGNDPQAARRFLDKAAALGSLSLEAQIAMGDTYLEEGDPSNAIQYWQKAQAEGNAAKIIILNRLVKAHQLEKDYPAMMEDLKELIILNPNEAALYYQLGLILTATQPESAPAYLEQAAAIDPQFSDTANTIRRSINTARLSGETAYTNILAGRALASIDEWDLAVEAFQQATLARPDYAEAWAFLGEARQHLSPAEEQQTQSLIELEKAYLLDPESLAANSFLALYWQRLGQLELALEYLGNATHLDPSNPAFHLEIGNTLSEMGNLPEAQTAYQKAIDLAPKDPLYWQALAEFALRHQIQLQELALPAALHAYELDPQNPSSLVTLGKTYYFLEEYDHAQQYLQEALAIDPDFPLAYLHIGLNYLVQGDVQQAAQSLYQARELAPNTAIAEKVDRLLYQYFP